MSDPTAAGGFFGTLPPLNLIPQQSPLVSVLHTERQMKIYGVTENELRTLSIVNAALAAFFSLGTGCFGYLLNLDTAIALAGNVPAATTQMITFARPGLFSLGAGFYFLGFVTWIMRHGFINTIKTESDPQRRQTARDARPGKLGRIWQAIRS